MWATDYAMVDEMPFDFSQRRMSVVGRQRKQLPSADLQRRGPEEVLAVCSRGIAGRSLRALDAGPRWNASAR